MKTIVLAAAVTALATGAFAQSNTSPSTANNPQQQKVSSATRQFVQKAAITDLFEIQAGQLAQQKASDNAYKEFGQTIVSDHEAASSQLRPLGQTAGVQVPAELDATHKQMLDKLQQLSGAQFETQFRAAQVQGHQQAVKLFETYAKSGDQTDLKQFAQQTLPKLQDHLKHAQALPKPGAPTVGSGGRSKMH